MKKFMLIFCIVSECFAGNLWCDYFARLYLQAMCEN